MSLLFYFCFFYRFLEFNATKIANISIPQLTAHRNCRPTYRVRPARRQCGGRYLRLVVNTNSRTSKAESGCRFRSLYHPIEKLHQLFQAVIIEPHVIQRHIQHFVESGESLLDMLQQQCCLADTACALNANEPHIPVYAAIQISFETQVAASLR